MRDADNVQPYWLADDTSQPNQEAENPGDAGKEDDEMILESVNNVNIQKKEKSIIESMVSEFNADKSVHISQRLAACLNLDKHSNKLDIIAELSTFRKDLLQVHVKKYQNGNKFSINFFKSNKNKREQHLDPLEMQELENEYIDL